jgi:glutamate---cysteine ligase / carboxylate-amine ligase
LNRDTGEDRVWPPSPEAMRATFDRPAAYTVGIEDEVMLLAPDSLDLLPKGPEVLQRLGGDPRFKLELPASQLEITTRSDARLENVVDELLDARRWLATRLRGCALPATAGAHPFTPALGELNRLDRYQPVIAEYGSIARLQLVCALQVHVAVGECERALAVYNAARSYLPLIAALAANAPFHQGRDTGLASIRPMIGSLLPRQGIPPKIETWERFAQIMRWGFETETFPSAQTWWWELRLHPAYGTLEFRVPDGQSSVSDAAAVAAVIQALVVWLGSRHDAGEQLPVASRWQLEENRWSACRHGVEGDMIALPNGDRRSTRALLRDLLATLEPVAVELGCRQFLGRAQDMVEVNGALAQRRAASQVGATELARWLTERFLVSP